MITHRCDPNALRAFFADIFSKAGVADSTAGPVIEGVLFASLRGVDSHGVRLVPHYLKSFRNGRLNPNPELRFDRTAAGTGMLDADDGHGMAAASVAMGKAIELAREAGVGAVTVVNSSHFGAAAIYSLMAAERDMIGLSCTHTDSLVVPHGGRRPYLGTNAISFAAPCAGDRPFCFDMATSVVSMNKVRVYREEGRSLEPGWVVDEEGNPCTDSSREVSLTHFGGYKGYGVALMVEVLCSTLTGMPFGPRLTPMFAAWERKRRLGHFLLAIDIARFQDVAAFKARLGEMLGELRSVPPAEGVPAVKVADDPEKEAFESRSREGIPVSDLDLRNFREAADLVGADKTLVERALLKR